MLDLHPTKTHMHVCMALRKAALSTPLFRSLHSQLGVPDVHASMRQIASGETMKDGSGDCTSQGVIHCRAAF